MTDNEVVTVFMETLSAALRQGAQVINEQQLEITRLRGRLELAESLIPYPPLEVSP